MEKEIQALLIDHPLELVMGLFTTLILGLLWTDKALDKVHKEFAEKKDKYGLEAKKEWNIIFEIPSVERSAGLGAAERILFYFSWLIFPEMIVGWFVFKVATKWETWNNIYKFPDKFNKWSHKDSLSARIWLGARTYQRFLHGAILNILVSLAGVGVFTFLPSLSIDSWYPCILCFLILFYLLLVVWKKLRSRLKKEPGSSS